MAYQISQEGKNMYRSAISFRKETALELGLTDFAAHNRMKTDHLCWAAAFYNEENHPISM
ncbi:hypothetical protein J2Z22_004801 [Paenibacillus forsythiae]|uniref:Uncharacterized protein n=1 Tax=Paenibacillus forsythiae TaxID=365616 RepID=A0ABU3HEQ5_9BACL|nr:hypothetical protein [Paenibacillus forsythiae]MDT3429200.1 hypothetical protein [Paenibacillus forsythiae]